MNIALSSSRVNRYYKKFSRFGTASFVNSSAFIKESEGR